LNGVKIGADVQPAQLLAHVLADALAIGPVLLADGDDSLVASYARFEPGQFGFPMRMDATGGMCWLDHASADVPPTGLGDAARAVSLTAVVHPRAQPGVADQVFGGGEAGDVPDGGEEGDGRDQAHARQLDEEGHALVGSGRRVDGLFEVRDLSLGEFEGVEVRLDAHELDGGEPPVAVEGIEQAPLLRRGQVMAVEHRVEAVLGLGGETHHLGALRDEGAAVAHLLRRYPDGREEADGVQAR